MSIFWRILWRVHKENISSRGRICSTIAESVNIVHKVGAPPASIKILFKMSSLGGKFELLAKNFMCSQG